MRACVRAMNYSKCNETAIGKSYVKSIIRRVRVPAKRFNWKIGIASIKCIQQRWDFDEPLRLTGVLITYLHPNPAGWRGGGVESYVIMVRGPGVSRRLRWFSAFVPDRDWQPRRKREKKKWRGKKKRISATVNVVECDCWCQTGFKSERFTHGTSTGNITPIVSGFYGDRREREKASNERRGGKTPWLM